MRHYLVPDIRTKTARSLYLDAFYALEPQMPDGMLYWKYRRQELPLLSHLSSTNQVAELHRVATASQVNAEFPIALAGLISCGVVNVSWLGSARWHLWEESEDSPHLRIALNTFSQAIVSERPAIGQRVAELMNENPNHGSAQAIRTARIEAAERVLRTVPDESRIQVRERFRSHLDDYMRADEEADIWANLAESVFGGHLADVIHDLDSNDDLVPFLEDADWTHFNTTLGGFSSRGGPQATRTVLREGLAIRIGLAFLSSLPKLSFRHAEEVAALRDRCRDELHAFHHAVLTYVNEYDSSGISANTLEALIRRELQDDVERLIRDRADRLGIAEILGGGSSVGLVVLTSAEPISLTILALSLLPTAIKAAKTRRKSLKNRGGLKLALRFS